ncbi:mitochondrial amidoxime reducing component 2-like isoform X2 [Leguminivora glycinivorella]|uniref:mitochondrial amidoxime reducing component 2-like isoform X2 n=1 Tax=Leguminivora glycinivorella TaxID=1035111 RepID=UPI00200CC125|nr:mitochondrial amidoxime reducing component 2-like isoform X2 [Leguminivora glycinivorella]
MLKQAPYTTAAVTAGVIGSAYFVYSIYQNRKRLPTEWTQVGTLENMYAYPIKSCGGVVMETAMCATLGLQDGWLRDRVLMVVDENGNFVTARNYPELLLVQPSVRNSILTLKHRDMEPVYVNLAESPKSAVVWGVTVPVLDCGWEVSEWFSRLLDMSAINFRLVYYATQKPRKLNLMGNTFYKFTKNDTGALTDETSYHLINAASVTDLNARLQSCQVTHHTFRPNFVVQGPQPYEEDRWRFLKIGDNVFEVIKPCFRCTLTTIDPETGVRREEREPLETLKTYRQILDSEERRASGNAPRMGLQLALRSGHGPVSIHDPVFAA